METNGIKQYGSIVEKTVLLRVNFRVIGNSRKVNTGSLLKLSSVANGALLKIQKTLFESAELKAITKADSEMRGTLHSMCVPYDMGLDLLPRESVTVARELMTAYRETRKALVNGFVNAYPELQGATKVKMEELALELGVPFEYLYNANDYPPVEYVAGKFGFDWDFLELTVPDELKLAGKFEESSAELQAKISNVTQEITIVMRQSLLDLVSHLKESLEPSADGKQKRLHATTITHLQDFLASLPARNITNDVELTKLAGDVAKLITPGVNVDLLKKDEHFKANVIESMGSIAGELAKLVEIVPGRKFRGASSAPVPEVGTVSEETEALTI
jgi:hypothetical protein